MQTFIAFVSALVIGPILDFVWFSLVASDIYKKQLGPLLRMENGMLKPELFPAVLVYILIALLVTFFVLPKGGSVLSLFLWGALAGLILYGVYDLTNISFLKDWTLSITLIDAAWGTFMVGVLTVIVSYILKIWA